MASLVLLEPVSSANPAQRQAILNEAPKFLKSQRGAFQLPYPADLLVSNESQEKWAAYENILIASLQAGQYDIAKECVEALTQRFGKVNERVLILQGLYDEATAEDSKRLEQILKRYDEVLAESPTMFGIRKRKIALLKSMGKSNEAVASLIELLDVSPTDAEAWTELADVYIAQASYDQAIFSLEEVLLVTPNAWNIHAKLGETIYLSAGKVEGVDRVRLLSEAVQRFCRSIELSDGYLRGFYGLRLSTDTLLPLLGGAVDSRSKDTTNKVPATKTIQRLNELATSKLAEIVRRGKAGEKGWDGYVESELLAAEKLLSDGNVKLVR